MGQRVQALPRRRNPIRKKSKKQLKKDIRLKEVNREVWSRDRGKCIRCGSVKIFGEPYVSGAHHILSRGISPSTYYDPADLCLLCIVCHGPYADTVECREELLTIMRERYRELYGEKYKQLPYSAYLEDEC